MRATLQRQSALTTSSIETEKNGFKVFMMASQTCCRKILNTVYSKTANSWNKGFWRKTEGVLRSTFSVLNLVKLNVVTAFCLCTAAQCLAKVFYPFELLDHLPHFRLLI